MDIQAAEVREFKREHYSERVSEREQERGRTMLRIRTFLK